MATEEKKSEATEKSAEQKAPASEAATPEAIAAKSRKRRMIVMIAGGAVAVLAVAGGAAFFLTKGAKPVEDVVAADGASDAEKTEEKKSEKADEKKNKGGEEHAAKVVDGVQFGATMPFKTFHLNLGNPLENHYLRLEISVEYKGGDTQKAEIDQRMPQLRDAVVSVASRKSREFLLGPDGKEQLRRELLIRLNRYMSKPVDAVYITDMLIE